MFPTCSTLSFKGWCHSRIFLWGEQPSLWATLSAFSVDWKNCIMDAKSHGKRSESVLHTQASDLPLPPTSGVATDWGREEEGGSGNSSGHHIVKSRVLSRPQRQTRFRAPWHGWLVAALFSPHPAVPEQLPRRAQSLQPVANEPDCPSSQSVPHINWSQVQLSFWLQKREQYLEAVKGALEHHSFLSLSLSPQSQMDRKVANTVQRILFSNHLSVVATGYLITLEYFGVVSFVFLCSQDTTIKFRKLTSIYYYHLKSDPIQVCCPSNIIYKERIQFSIMCGICFLCLCSLLCLEHFLSLSWTWPWHFWRFGPVIL